MFILSDFAAETYKKYKDIPALPHCNPQYQTRHPLSYDKYLSLKNPFAGICNNTVVAAAVRAARIPDAAHINILLFKRWGSLYHWRAQIPFHTGRAHHLPHGFEHPVAWHHKWFLGTSVGTIETYLAGSTQRFQPWDNAADRMFPPPGRHADAQQSLFRSSHQATDLQQSSTMTQCLLQQADREAT